LLEGKNVNLRIAEKDDVDFLVEFTNDVNLQGEFMRIERLSKAEWTRAFYDPSNSREGKMFIIQKRDGTRIGRAHYRLNEPYGWTEIRYSLFPNERRRGYGTEAVQLMVDYLFLSKGLVRIQAIIDVRNKASQRVVEKAGFQKEGTIRKCLFNRGEWRDYYLYSII
jgi:RimJ/RimL family protein N-acetyltransferase